MSIADELADELLACTRELNELVDLVEAAIGPAGSSATLERSSRDRMLWPLEAWLLAYGRHEARRRRASVIARWRLPPDVEPERGPAVPD